MMPIWKFLPARWAHELAPIGVAICADLWGDSKPLEWNPLTWKGLRFPNRLGVAGGVDKNAEQGLFWQQLGAGFLEIGTVTPEPQDPNPGKIIDRDWNQKNLWNKMGFPNQGAQDSLLSLRKWKSDLQIPLFVNLGKNRWTTEDKAEFDYQSVLEIFLNDADGFVINVSSPNTSGLRNLQKSDSLKKLCESVIPKAKGKPVLVKLSPDMPPEDLQQALDAAVEAGISGFILTNTTLSRPTDCPFPKEGGLSGKDLQARSKLQLELALKHLGARRKDLLIISTGGILSYSDIQERLKLGADLVQVYSALVFEGPLFFRNMNHQYQGEH